MVVRLYFFKVFFGYMNQNPRTILRKWVFFVLGKFNQFRNCFFIHQRTCDEFRDIPIISKSYDKFLCIFHSSIFFHKVDKNSENQNEIRVSVTRKSEKKRSNSNNVSASISSTLRWRQLPKYRSAFGAYWLLTINQVTMRDYANMATRTYLYMFQLESDRNHPKNRRDFLFCQVCFRSFLLADTTG